MLHLSFPVRDLDEAIEWYVQTLACQPGRRRTGWADVWFYGMQVTLQQRPAEVLPLEQVGSRHFGVAISPDEMGALVERLHERGVAWAAPPSVEFGGTAREQWKAKLLDPSGNVIEIKSYVDLAAALEVPT